MVQSYRSPERNLGFIDEGGVHLRRSTMYADLSALFDQMQSIDARSSDYRHAIIADNLLHKPTATARALSFKYLRQLYSLEPDASVFYALRFFWQRDLEGRPLLALLCAYARDDLLRQSAPLILEMAPGVEIARTEMEQLIRNGSPERYGAATVNAAAGRLLTSWAQSGHLMGRAKKKRSSARSTPGAVAYALYLGYLKGARNALLFSTEYSRLLDCPAERAMELAAVAGRRGWIVYRQIGDIIEVEFPELPG